MSLGCWRAWAAAAKRLIGATLPLSILTLILWTVPAAAEQLQFDHSRVVTGEWWRIVTCHFTHWSTGHLVWDLAAFVLLGRLCGWRSPKRLLTCLGTAAVAIPLVVGLCQPGMLYRGLSGLDSALFTLLAAWLLRQNTEDCEWRGIVLPAITLLAFAGKITYESLSGNAIFVSGADMVPVPLAHLAGAGVGLCFGLIGGNPPLRSEHRETAATNQQSVLET